MPAKRSARNSPKRAYAPHGAYFQKALSFPTLLQIVALPFILLLLLAIVWIVLNVPLLNQYRVYRLERDQHRETVRQLEGEVADLEKTESQFQDGLAVEQILRKRYRMVKAGKSGKPSEQLIQIKYESLVEK